MYIYIDIYYLSCNDGIGKDHMQIQIIPIPSSCMSSTITTFMQTASDYNLKFSEISDTDGSVDEVVISMEGYTYTLALYILIHRFTCMY